MPVLSALTAVYLIWGSTYLAIRFAIETMPPLLMAGVRFFLAGLVLYGWMRIRGVSQTNSSSLEIHNYHRGLPLVEGMEELSGGTSDPVGIGFSLISTVPVWMVLLDWLGPHGRRPTLGVFSGVILGFLGVALLIDPFHLTLRSSLNLSGAAVLSSIFSFVSIGSIYARQAALPSSPLLATAWK